MSVKGRVMKDYTGLVYGELTVVRFAGRDRGSRALWECLCSCGRRHITLAQNLNSGNVKSCGHLRREKSVLNLPLTSTHGRPVRHPLYVVWNNMINRCYNEKNSHYSAYGGRGITVCRRWHFYANFYDDNISKWGDRLEIDRENNEQGYYPANVRFVSRKVNANNTRAQRRVKERKERFIETLREKVRSKKTKPY